MEQERKIQGNKMVINFIRTASVQPNRSGVFTYYLVDTINITHQATEYLAIIMIMFYIKTRDFFRPAESFWKYASNLEELNPQWESNFLFCSTRNRSKLISITIQIIVMYFSYQ